MRTLLVTGLALGAVVFPDAAAAAHFGLVFKDTLIGFAALVLGFGVTWLVLAVRSRRCTRRDRSQE